VIDQPLIDAVEWAVNLAFWSAIAFPFLIIWVWPWWRDWMGQTMVAMDYCLAAATFSLVLRYDFGVTFTSLAWVDVIALATIPAVLAWRSVMIFRTQRKRRTRASNDGGTTAAGT